LTYGRASDAGGRLAQVVEELSGAGVAERTYTYGLQRISEYQPISNVWTASFYGYDGGGNVRQLTNTSGTVTDTYEYDAFGNALVTTGTTPNNYLYRGEQFDPDLGLYYLRARYYNPATGRFMSRDPEDGNGYDPKSLHKYLYAQGDPLDGIDPTGRIDVIQSALSDSVIVSSPLEINVEMYSRLVWEAICGIARVVRSFTKWAPPGVIPSPVPFIPLWSFTVLDALCTATAS